MTEQTLDKPKKIDAAGRAYYGDKFVRYMRLPEVQDLIPAFKDFYYQAKVKDPNARLSQILQDFNTEVCEPMGRLFHPNTINIRHWRTKWDLDLMQQMQDKDLKVIERKNVHQIIKTRDEDRKLVLGAPDDNQLEA